MDMSILESSDRLRLQLSRLSLTQRGAAALLGRDERTMRRWLSGDRPMPAELLPYLKSIEEISDLTGETPREILTRIGAPEVR